MIPFAGMGFFSPTNPSNLVSLELNLSHVYLLTFSNSLKPDAHMRHICVKNACFSNSRILKLQPPNYQVIGHEPTQSVWSKIKYILNRAGLSTIKPE